jgi:sugar phosphate permease
MSKSNDLGENIKRSPKLFYGWWIVGACFLLSVLSGGIFIIGFTAFIEPIVNEFGWSYAQVSLAASLRGANVGLLAPLMGILVDRWGPRRLLFVGVILLGLSLFLLCRLTSLIMFYGVFAIVAVGISGLSPTVMVTAVNSWFRKNAGLAIGIMSCGFSLGSLLVPMMVKIIDTYSWRTAALLLAIVILILGIPLSLLVRHKPEHYGYLPDGEKSNGKAQDESTVDEAAIKVNMGIKEVIRSRTFWHIGLAMMLLFLPISAVTVHVMPYLSSVGVERTHAGMVAMAMPLVSVIGRLSAGWLGDRFKRTRVATAFMLLIFLGLLFFSYASAKATWLLIPFIILFGIGWGSNLPMRAALIKEYFKSNNIGTIFGFLMGLSAIGAVIGPIIAGWFYDNYGSYRVSWLLFACLAFVAMIIMITTPSSNTNTNRDNNRLSS